MNQTTSLEEVPSETIPNWRRRLGARGRGRFAKATLSSAGWKVLVLGTVIVMWEGWVRLFDVNPLLFPAFSDVVKSLLVGFGVLSTRPGLEQGAFYSLSATTLDVILRSYAISIALALLLTSFAISSRLGREVLNTATGIFQPMPSIALLPMAMLWFGLNEKSLIFVVVMAMVWPIAASLTVGFATVPQTLLRVGRNYELKGPRLVFSVLLPRALPSAIGGLRVGWGYGWRTVVAAELVFGATGGTGGLGWFINNTRLYLALDNAIAGILVVVLIGLLTESLFRLLQMRTTLRWGIETY